MDTSETYIKMCAKAKEIQAAFIDDGSFHNYFHRVDAWHSLIWLPCQDQLQEMYLKTLNKDEQQSINIPIVILDDFSTWVLEDAPDIAIRRHALHLSLEQLWLAFVMKKKYNKEWNGSEWVSYQKKR